MNKQGQQEWWGVEAEGCGGWFCWIYVLVFCWFCRFFVVDSVKRLSMEVTGAIVRLSKTKYDPEDRKIN